MIRNYAHELEEQYMPYAIFGEEGEIIGFVENTPLSAKRAAKEHIRMSQKFDDISNMDYWEDLTIKLGLDKID